jgi:hypothetical protein
VKIEIYGHSDDCLEVRVDGKDDEEFSCFEVNEDGKFTDYLLISSVGGARNIRVTPVYDGTWSYAFTMHCTKDCGADDDPPVPPWKMSCEKEHGYSMKAIIESEPDEPLTYRWFRKGKEVKDGED